jgi:hypothetical protein|tara:strand:- start:203 stop:355 length:153 start_codon:yes stop_codon:yes gene_type:complete
MKKLMITQSILWAAAILLPVINPEASWWLIIILAVVALDNLRRELNKKDT